MRKHIFVVSAVVLSALAGLVSSTLAEDKPGYTDTPLLPSGKWHVHDPNRPVPPVVTPGAKYSDLAPAPSDAIVLFDGTDFSHWEGDKGPVPWSIHDNYMECKPFSGDIHTKEKFADFQLHIEWAEPPPKGNSQERGNSGVFLQGVYEMQVLDCYNNPTYPDGQCGAIYGQSPPLANVCRPPGEWQTYDIIFEAARWNADHQLTRPASVTIIQNGVLIQNHQPILGPTGHRILAKYDKELPESGPVGLQDHHNTVRYRNIWVRNLTDEEKP